jgi:hypothetical protein
MAMNTASTPVTSRLPRPLNSAGVVGVFDSLNLSA